MTLAELNESSWIGNVAKTFKKNGTTGAFTAQCKDMGFRGPSMGCVNYVYKEYEKQHIAFKQDEISKETYDYWLQLKRRASFAKTSKKLGRKRRKSN